MGRFDHLEIGDTQLPQPDDVTSGGEIVDESSYLERADRAFSEGNYERALSFYSRTLQYDINLEAAWLGQIRCLIELQELQEAVIWSERALERFANSAQILAARGVAECRMGKHASAIGFVDAAFGAQNVTPYVWVARGEILISDNPLNAKACFSKAIEISPANPDIYVWIGCACAAHNCDHQALEYLRRAVHMDSNRFACWYWIGNCCEDLGEKEEAKIAYRRAVAANPSFVKARDAALQLERRGFVSRIVDGFRRLFR